MPKKKPSKETGAKITQAEWEVMQILWNADAPLSAAEVIDRLETKANWNPKTVRTFLSRLVQKQAVHTVKQDRAGYELLHYVPLIDRASALQAKQATFADRFFGGTVHSMLAGCIQSGEISIDELRELREMIDSKIEERDDD
jgi:BlaI family penicillinase repressor